MSIDIGLQIPDILKSKLTSAIPEQEALPLISLDDKGYPHVALLSYLELLLIDGQLYFFLSNRSRSASNLQKRPICTVLFFSPGYAFYFKGKATFLFTFASQSVFHFNLKTVLQDFPEKQEEGSGLKSGLNFGLDPDALRVKLTFRQKIREKLAG